MYSLYVNNTINIGSAIHKKRKYVNPKSHMPQAELGDTRDQLKLDHRWLGTDANGPRLRTGRLHLKNKKSLTIEQFSNQRPVASGVLRL